jgi:hypothetical protein
MHEGRQGAGFPWPGLPDTYDELPLRDFGNRIPNITAEVVSAARVVHPSQQLDVVAHGVESHGKHGWIIDRGRPYIYNRLSTWLLKIERVSGQVLYRQRLDETILLSWRGGRPRAGAERRRSPAIRSIRCPAICSSTSAAHLPGSMPIR